VTIRQHFPNTHPQQEFFSATIMVTIALTYPVVGYEKNYEKKLHQKTDLYKIVCSNTT